MNTEKPLILSLHLDHKAHAYTGQRAHGGDYDSNIVRAEALRIWNAIQGISKEESEKRKDGRSGDDDRKGFFGKFFG